MAESKKFNMGWVIVGLLIINILFLAYLSFFKRDAVRLEKLKVGGAENMKLVTKLYQSEGYELQQKSAIEQVLSTMGSEENVVDQEDDEEDMVAPTANTDNVAKFAAITADGYIKGNENAKITIIEYSDLLCPYCKRHYDDQTVENLVKKYSKDVNMIFRQMPLPQLHPTAPLGAQWAVCVGQLAGADKFYKYLDKAFAVNEFTQDNVTAIATGLWIKKSTFVECLNSQETIAKVAAETAEWQSLWVRGTPGNIIVDNEKGTFTLLAWAYPAADFEKIITSILSK